MTTHEAETLRSANESMRSTLARLDQQIAEARARLAEAKEQAAAADDCFRTEALMHQYRRDASVLGPQAAGLASMLSLIDRRQP